MLKETPSILLTNLAFQSTKKFTIVVSIGFILHVVLFDNVSITWLLKLNLYLTTK